MTKPTTTIPRKETVTAKPRIIPAILFERVSVNNMSKDQYASFKLRSDPTSANSPTYEQAIRHFNDSTPEEWLLYLNAVQQVLVGQNITTRPQKYAMHRRLLKGDALSIFNEAVTMHGNKNNMNLNLVLRDVTTHVFPDKALIKQKLYMNRYLRKPKEVKICQFIARLKEINTYLEYFPPYNVNQGFTEDNICLLYTSPSPRDS